jgi:hypothetical protein
MGPTSEEIFPLGVLERRRSITMYYNIVRFSFSSSSAGDPMMRICPLSITGVVLSTDGRRTQFYDNDNLNPDILTSRGLPSIPKT